MLNNSSNPSRRTFIRWGLLLLPALLVAGVDQASKATVANSLAIGQSWTPIPALAPIFEITRSVNSGAAFGLFQGANLMLLGLSLAMLVGIVVYFQRLPAVSMGQAVPLGLLIGGVIGNALDRLRLGTVVDFIHWQLPGVISNVSNLADHAIVLSVIGLLIIQWRAGVRGEREQAAIQSGEK
jgi:signal peptidase II